MVVGERAERLYGLRSVHNSLFPEYRKYYNSLLQLNDRAGSDHAEGEKRTLNRSVFLRHLQAIRYRPPVEQSAALQPRLLDQAGFSRSLTVRVAVKSTERTPIGENAGADGNGPTRRPLEPIPETPLDFCVVRVHHPDESNSRRNRGQSKASKEGFGVRLSAGTGSRVCCADDD